MQWYSRARETINIALPFLVCTQKTNLALLVSAILKKQTLCLSELARAYPVPDERRVATPKHCLLHCLKRLWRFTASERVDATELQLALVSHTIFRLGYPRWVGLAIDWAMFDTTLPSGERIRYQVPRILSPAQGTGDTSVAAGLRPRPSASEQKSEPAGAGRPLGRRGSAP